MPREFVPQAHRQERLGLQCLPLNGYREPISLPPMFSQSPGSQGTAEAIRGTMNRDKHVTACKAVATSLDAMKKCVPFGENPNRQRVVRPCVASPAGRIAAAYLITLACACIAFVWWPVIGGSSMRL